MTLHRAACAAVAVSLATGAAFAAGAPAGGKCLLVLQCGSDWCESGEDVRRVFESRDFRRALGPKFDFAVYDDMDAPTPQVRAANEKLSRLRVKSMRFPAITCLTSAPRRLFAQFENVPFDVTAKTLAGRVLAAAKSKDEAVKMFAKARSLNDAAKSAELCGRAFRLLAANVGENLEKHLLEGALAWSREWELLSKHDADDRFGWKMRFTCGTGIGFVEKATKFRKDGDFGGGEKFIANLRTVPTNNLTVVQRQSVEIAEYALWRTDASRMDSNKDILRRALALGRDTVWGQCALGYLAIAGEDIERRERRRAALLPRPPAEPDARRSSYPLEKVETQLSGIRPGDGLDEQAKFRVAQYAVLRRTCREEWDELAARPGSREFMRRFFSDRAWMEDFAWSGACDDWANALLALESTVFQDGGRWIRDGDRPGRRFATALALSIPHGGEALLADVLDAYRATALGKRLHKAALTQPVWRWRFAIRHLTSRPPSMPREFDFLPQIAEQQRIMDAFANVPLAEYAGTFRLVPWRNDNCLGEWVQRDKYYEPWVAAGEWPARRYTPTVGGVCGELSNIGAACANAHGLPAAPVGQPRHCAYARRLPDGRWEIDYSINAGTGFHSILPFRDTFSWTYFQAHEGTFEGDREKRLDADRYMELAILAEGRKDTAADVAAFYKAACRAWPSHYVAWRTYAEWIVRSERPLEEHRAFADECSAALRGWRQPLWDIAAAYFGRVAAEQGAAALADELVRMAPAFRQGEDAIQEEGFFDRALEKWMEPLKDDAALKERVLSAMMAAQAGTRDYSAQLEKMK